MILMTVGTPAGDPEAAAAADDDGPPDPPPLDAPLLAPGAEEGLTETLVERTPHADGSVSARVSTTTPHANGYRDVRVDHYWIPASDVESVDWSPGAPPPPDECLVRVEYKVLSPGLELEPQVDDDASTVYTSNVTGSGSPNDVSSVDGSYASRRRRRGKRWRCSRTLLLVSTVAVLLVALLGASFARDWTAGQHAGSSPGYGGPPSPPPTSVPAAAPTTDEGDAMDDNGGDAGPADGREAEPGPSDHSHHHHHHHKAPPADPRSTSFGHPCLLESCATNRTTGNATAPVDGPEVE